MTPRQRTFYWQMVRQALEIEAAARGLDRLDKATADALRHQWHIEALGADKSSRDFSNADFDRVKARLLRACKPDDLGAALAEVNDDAPARRRMIHAIQQYHGWAAIARNRWGTDNLDELRARELGYLAITCTQRVRAARRKRELASAAAPNADCRAGTPEGLPAVPNPDPIPF